MIRERVEILSSELIALGISEDEIWNTTDAYRGASMGEAVEAAKAGHLTMLSREPMSVDWEVIEYGLGDTAEEMTEEEVDRWVADLVPWESPPDKPGWYEGVNLTTDVDNAIGYAESRDGVVIAVWTMGPVAVFSDAHLLAKNPEDCKIVGILYNDNWYTSEEFLEEKMK